MDAGLIFNCYRVASICFYSVIFLWRCEWHSILTATGSDAMWQGAVSIWTASAVVLPVKPCGPIFSVLILWSRSFSICA